MLCHCFGREKCQGFTRKTMIVKYDPVKGFKISLCFQKTEVDNL